MSQKEKKEGAALREVADALKRDYPDLADTEIDTLVEQAHRAFYDRPIREFIPLFVERRVRAQLAKKV